MSDTTVGGPDRPKGTLDHKDSAEHQTVVKERDFRIHRIQQDIMEPCLWFPCFA